MFLPLLSALLKLWPRARFFAPLNPSELLFTDFLDSFGELFGFADTVVIRSIAESKFSFCISLIYHKLTNRTKSTKRKAFICLFYLTARLPRSLSVQARTTRQSVSRQFIHHYRPVPILQAPWLKYDNHRLILPGYVRYARPSCHP